MTSMKQVLVIGSVSDGPTEGAALKQMQDYVQTALGTGQAEVFSCHLDQVGYYFSNQGSQITDLVNNKDLKDYGLVFFRGKMAVSLNAASVIAQYLKENGVPHANTAYSKRRPVGKIPQMMQCASLGLPLPITVAASAKYLPQLIDEHLTYPTIVKDVVGAHGDNNYLVKDAGQLAEILQKQPEIQFMAQQFVPNNGDYRVLFVGPQTAIIHRQSQGDSHLNNTSVGGQATLIPVKDFPAKVIQESHQFAELCDYEIAGVDVIFDSNTNEHYFLEINSQPQLMTGAEVPLKQEMLKEYFSQLLGL